jgi:transposase
MRTAAYQSVLKAVEMDETGILCRSQLFSLLEHLNGQITELEKWLQAKGEANKEVQLLLSQKGVGYLTALSMVHTVGDISRFSKLSKQVTGFVGLDPLERSSAGKIRFGSISKAGSPLLRYQLGMSALVATRFDEKLKSFYKRLAKKKPRAVAKTACARKLLVKLSIMLRDNITAEEFDRRGRTVGNARLPQGLQ